MRGTLALPLSLALTLSAVAGPPRRARADEGAPPDVAAAASAGAFDRDFALGVYFSSWSGDYGSRGVGFRIRWEPLDELGVEVFSEVLSVDTGGRGDQTVIPAGFSLYLPIALVEGVRVRPLAGFCTLLSFAEGADGGASNDVLFGVHAGVGAEVALSSRWSLFADAVYQGYFGHPPEGGRWTNAKDTSEIARTDSFQATIGAAFHL